MTFNLVLANVDSDSLVSPDPQRDPADGTQLRGLGDRPHALVPRAVASSQTKEVHLDDGEEEDGVSTGH